MATIRTAIQLQDGMTSVVRSMSSALNICISSFESMQRASGNAVNTASISAARAELNKASVAMNSVEQNIREADAAQQKLNAQMRDGKNAAEGMAGKVKEIAIGLASAIGLTKMLGLSDSVAQTTARLNIMNDGLQTTDQLQRMIFQSAQRARSSYSDTANAVAKLGILAKDAFSSNAEMVMFAEQMNKQFTIGGASIQEQTAGMYQLTQAMATGKLQGDEFRSIMENAPMLAQAIAKYTGNSMGELKDMSSEGKITAQIIKNAMFAAIDETNAKFASMPKTFGQVWISIKNQALMAFQPVLQQLNGIANSKSFESTVNSIIGGLVILSSVVAKVFNEIIYIGGVISDNWSLIAPVVWALTAAFVAYNGVALITNGIMAVQGAMKAIATAATIAATGATFMQTVAQYGLNAALYACPITWIIVAIIALIAIFYLAVAAMNKWAGTSISATGIIVGAFFWLGSMIYNIIASVWNATLAYAEFLANVFRDPTAAIYNLFASIWNGIVELVGRSINEIIGLINKLPGMNLGFVNWGNGLASKMNIQNGADLSAYKMDYSSGNFMKGYGIGRDIGNFSLSNIGLPGQGAGIDFTNQSAANDLADTAKNTGAMKDKMDISTEDLKYLRDIAEQEVINRFTTAEIKIDMGGVNNNISSNMDLDGVTNYLRDTLVETMQVAAEKVHK